MLLKRETLLEEDLLSEDFESDFERAYSKAQKEFTREVIKKKDIKNKMVFFSTKGAEKADGLAGAWFDLWVPCHLCNCCPHGSSQCSKVTKVIWSKQVLLILQKTILSDKSKICQGWFETNDAI